MKITISTSLVAWYAAIVSTAMLFVSFLEYRRSSVKVTMRIKANRRLLGDVHPYRTDIDYLVISVINRGIRPVTIENVGAITKGKNTKNFIITSSLQTGPREIKSGQSTDYLVEQNLIDFSIIKYFVAYDSTGKRYKRKFKI